MEQTAKELYRLYYLESRYYDPETGRFISADVYLSTNQGVLGNNAFLYCRNNPVVRKDSEGTFWHLIVGAVVGVATQYVADVVSNLASGKSFSESLKPTSSWADYGSAAVSGALAASGIGSVAANAALGGATYVANCQISGETVNGADFLVSVGIGGIAGAIGGRGADGKNLRGIVKTSKSILKSAVSPKKISMYTGKIAAVKSTVIVGTIRTALSSGFTSVGNHWRRQIIDSIM